LIDLIKTGLIINMKFNKLDGNVQQILREVKLNILFESECKNYAEPLVEQKYCSGSTGISQDTCQVRFKIFLIEI
jgi:hypothetical protein